MDIAVNMTGSTGPHIYPVSIKVVVIGRKLMRLHELTESLSIGMPISNPDLLNNNTVVKNCFTTDDDEFGVLCYVKIDNPGSPNPAAFEINDLIRDDWDWDILG